ncbi:hypothetical protein [Runella limosa]|jgi:hypothetical protein|uniref:hypothetical protein n=1 Tax=Runella limosa TaxID=370978 RepID=UPI00042563C5|nr:hypothetical protein [Runella limosa]
MKTASLLLFSIACLGLSSCNLFKKKDPDPLANAAGTYVGSVQDNTTIIQNARANITTSSSNGRLYVSSIGITSSSYQLVLTGFPNGTFSGTRNGFPYSGQVTVNGSTLNITGSYRLTNTSSPTFANFSFTGTKQ